MRASLLALAAGLAIPAAALGATLNVNSTADTLVAGDGQCTLREAIINANGDSDTTAGDCAAGSGADLINVPAGSYEIGGIDGGHGGHLDVADELTLRGAGAAVTVIDAQGIDTVIEVHQSVAAIERVTLTGGSFGFFWAGGIVNDDAVLTVSDSIVSGTDGGCREVFFAYGCAAGIVQVGGTTTLRRSAVTNNRLGIRVDSGGVLRVENSTISANTDGARFFCVPGIFCGCIAEPAFYAPDAVVDVAYSTIADNLVDPSPSCVTRSHGAALLGDAVFEASVISNPGMTNCLGSVQSTGHNIDSDGSCGLTDPTDLSGQDPLLSSLRDNGGPTPTHALFSGSPAIDAIPAAACSYDHDGDPGTPELALTQDQRGAPRPTPGDAGRCDIGAYEGTLDNALPVAACQDVSVPTDPGACHASPSVDAGSSDADDDPLTIEQTPAGPYPPGTTAVTLRVTDPYGASDSCQAQVTVRDEEAPQIECLNPNPIPHERFREYYVSAVDNCRRPAPGVPLLVCGSVFSELSACAQVTSHECFALKKNGQRVERRCEARDELFLLKIDRPPKKKSHVRWTVVATDSFGNEANGVCEAVVDKVR